MKQKKSSEKGISKKEIRSKIQDSVNSAVVQYEKEGPSKRVKKAVEKASKKIAGKIKRDLKKVKSKKAKVSKKVNGEKVKAQAVA
jgi:hypothetical protein